jgi:hypothetical protein
MPSEELFGKTIQKLEFRLNGKGKQNLIRSRLRLVRLFWPFSMNTEAFVWQT